MLRHYFSLAVKVLLRRKFFTLISLFGISFTLLVLTVITAMFDHTFAPMAPETRQARTLGVYNVVLYGANNETQTNPGHALLDTHARDLPGVERLSLYSSAGTVHSYVGGHRIESTLKRTDDEFWRILEFTFVEGGPYTTADFIEARFVAVINAATRQRFFEGRPAVGETIEADGQRFRVVGVVEDVSEIRQVPFADMWVPYTTAKTDAWRRGIMGSFHAIALARDGASLAQIQEEFNSRLLQVELPKGFMHIVAPFETHLQLFARMMPTGDRKDPGSQVWRMAALLVTLAGLFALIPTVNLVNINISRIMERASEIGVRKAFGAPARTLLGQFLVENVLLTLIGGLLGLVMSVFVLRAINESGMIRYSQLALNARVFVYGMAIAIIFGVLSGVYPAWRMSRLNPVDALKGGVPR